MARIYDAWRVVGFIWKHPGNRGRRLRQIGRAAAFQLLARAVGRRTQTEVGRNGGKIWVDLYRTAATKALYANPPDWPSMIVWEQYLSPGDLFVDVGANIGTYSILAASLGASVIAVEPAADTAALLRENVALNEADISVIEAAAGATSGELRFSAGRDAVNRADPEGPLTVPMVTLDTIIGDRTVAGMKLDIEGYEIEALNGARRLLTDQRIGLLQLEWNGAADRAPIVEILGSCGYRLKRVLADGHLAGYQGEAAEDLFAVPEQPD